MSDRTEFNLTWLVESPVGIGDFPAYDGLCSNIRGAITYGYPITTLPNNLKKIEEGNLLYYWYGTKDNILLGSELHVRDQGLVVSITGKKPELAKNPPYASDLYLAILQDTNRAIRLLSDEQLSNDGFKLWKRLYDGGACVAVYDNKEKTAGQSFKLLPTLKDFNQYFSEHDSSYARYQYVIMKKGSSAMAETMSYFGLRRLRETAGLDLEDFAPTWNRIL